MRAKAGMVSVSVNDVPSSPILRNLSYRAFSRASTVSADTSASAAESAWSTSAVAASGSVCAPPVGSGTTASMRPSASMSGAVIFSAAAASTLRFASRQRIAAQPSGGITL